MRDIKFKAKRVDNDEWVEGYYAVCGTDSATPGQAMILSNGGFISYAGLLFHNVIKETVCQYTGLKDKNGKEIYEGDILRFHYFYMSFGENMGAAESEHELVGVVQWQEYGYGLSAIKGEHWKGYTGYSDGEGYSDFLHLAGMSEFSVHEESFEIIGNEFDNPELLK